MSAEMMPASMLSPPSLVATWCSARTAAASMRVVVDLPLVPVTSTAGRPPPRLVMMEGSMALAIRPPIIPPAPRPVAREAVVASFAADVAAVVRNFFKAPGTEKLMPPRVVGEAA